MNAPVKKPRGRPVVPHHLQRVHVPLRLPRWLAEWMSNPDPEWNRTFMIELAIREHFKPWEPK